MNCPSGALAKNGDSGVIDWDENKCVNCLLCTAGCAYAGIVYEAAVGHVTKCDMCDGDPACVKACPTRRSSTAPTARIFNAYADKEDLFCRGLAACHGCNSELLIRHTMRMVGPDAVVAAPPGCIPGMGIGRLQRADRRQGADLPFAADQHRHHAGRRKDAVRPRRAERHGHRAGGRRWHRRRRLPVALGRGRAQRPDSVHLRRQ